MPGFSTMGVSPGASNANVSIAMNVPGAATAAKQIQTVGKQTGSLTKGLGLLAIKAYAAHTAFKLVQKTVSDSIRHFREFETRIAEINTILGDTGDKVIPGLASNIEYLSLKFGQATSDLSKGMYDILSAAFSARDSIYLLDVATRASIAGLSTVRESVDIFTTVLNSYGMSAYQAKEVSDSLFQSVVRGKFQFKDLSSALQYIVPIAAQAGVSFNEMMAALSTATRHGLRLDMTSRGLALAIQNIINPTESAAAAARELGIDMSSIGLRVLGLEGWFRELNRVANETGATVIPKLIKNMRSLRVAMVLAGDEGIEGFTEDLGLLEGAAGRTEEALAKITETAQFQSNILNQEIADLERNFGSLWSDIGLKWQAFWVDVGTFFDPMRDFAKAGKEIADMAGILPTISDNEVKNARSYLKLLDDAQTISEEMSKHEFGSGGYRIREGIYQAITKAMEDFVDAYASIISNVESANEELLDNKQLLLDIELAQEQATESLERYNEELEILTAKKQYADFIHDVNIGLKMQNYQYRVLDQELIQVIERVKELTGVQEENNLEIMRLQLKGMRRRRGLTRGEQQQMKMLRIENLETRIEMTERNKVIDEAILKEKELEYWATYTYDKQIKALETLVTDTKTELDRLAEHWITTNNKIIASLNALTAAKIKAFSTGATKVSEFKDQGFSLPYTRSGILDLVRSMRGHQRGTHYVPKTGPALLHKGEQVVPAGSSRNVGGGRTNATININISEIRNYTDIEDLGSQIALAVKNNILSTDTSKYGMR